MVLTPLLKIILTTLAAFRLAQLMVFDDGPFDLLRKIRAWAGTERLDEDGRPRTNLGRLLACTWCAGVWTALFCVGLACLPAPWPWLLLGPWAVAGVGILLDRVLWPGGA